MFENKIKQIKQHSGNVTAVLGRSAILNCRVEAVGNRTVIIIISLVMIMMIGLMIIIISIIIMIISMVMIMMIRKRK